MNDIFVKIQKLAKGIMFADDFSVMCKDNSLAITTKILQSILDDLANWTEETGFKFSPTKSEFIVFSRRRE